MNPHFSEPKHPGIANSVEELIGRTPLLRVSRYSSAVCANDATILAKLELFNPMGSVKDRAALFMINQAEKDGLIHPPDATIIEPTSGNTGIGLAMICARRGYKLILTMPDTMSLERRQLVTALGAQVILTPGSQGMVGAVEKAEALHLQTPNSFIPSQFSNPANAEAHRTTTGPEIWTDTSGNVDIFVAGIGTGGTITGVGEFLKFKKPSIKIIAVEPKDSPLLTEGRAGSHGLQGIGANFVPTLLNKDIYDEVIPVSTDEAFAASRTLAATEGVLVGISSGAALHVATVLAKRPENRAKTIVVLLPDTGERYLSTALWKIDQQ